MGEPNYYVCLECKVVEELNISDSRYWLQRHWAHRCLRIDFGCCGRMSVVTLDPVPMWATEDPKSDSLLNKRRGKKMKHEVNGLGVDVRFNKFQLRETIIKKIVEAGEIDHHDLRQSFIDDLVKDGFLRAELGSIVMGLEQDKIIEGELKPKILPAKDKKGVATRHYRVRSSEQDGEVES